MPVRDLPRLEVTEPASARQRSLLDGVIDARKSVAVGTYGTVLRTTNGGVDWTIVSGEMLRADREPAGIYFCRLDALGLTSIRKLVLVK